jgi:hypothetical protein
MQELAAIHGINLIQFGNDRLVTLFDDIRFESTTPVPEPATMLLLGSGLIELLAFRKRLRKS